MTGGAINLLLQWDNTFFYWAALGDQGPGGEGAELGGRGLTVFGRRLQRRLRVSRSEGVLDEAPSSP